ncbi:class I SAM-dependent methyltransferase [Actinocatenispora sera]|uniref:Methyltransferase n=1 Tax=Actinocatenispora sera TaxID=390989 RepID=A0A810KX03_9ACTN|nr:class I SAM-dependent methyltransferase [Actinocatenispora sera]BCJ27205.1 methyltransferase [Actinocatenispora sera]
MTYLSPLGYLLGVEGAALLRGMRDGTGDRAYVEARIAEIRALLADPTLRDNAGLDAVPGNIDTAEVYDEWAAHYDGANSMIELEQPLVREILAALPVGTALDAACGTGRHAGYLAGLGHRVIGVDANARMLAVAEAKLPELDLRRGPLEALPLDADSVDLVVCALALCHAPDLAAVFAEFARVLRPGGHLVVSDPHQVLSCLRPTLPRAAGPDGRRSILVEYHRPLSAYLTAALPLGFQLRHCAEPHAPRPERTAVRPPMPTEVSWELLDQVPDAATVAMDVPSIVLLHLQLPAA